MGPAKKAGSNDGLKRGSNSTSLGRGEGKEQHMTAGRTVFATKSKTFTGLIMGQFPGTRCWADLRGGSSVGGRGKGKIEGSPLGQSQVGLAGDSKYSVAEKSLGDHGKGETEAKDSPSQDIITGRQKRVGWGNAPKA